METYKAAFIEFMVHAEVLTFGNFTTKSGRKTPFFINTGKYKTGEQIRQLGEFYAEAVHNQFGNEFDVIFGPAYKGIPLVVTTAIALEQKFQINTNFCFNRKERKDHGERGTLVGHQLQDGDRVIIIEDVTTAGTSIRETIPLLRAAAKVTIQGLTVSVDRMEKGQTNKGALSELRDEYQMTTGAIVTLDDIIEYLTQQPIDGKKIITAELLKRINEYRAQYGISQ